MCVLLLGFFFLLGLLAELSADFGEWFDGSEGGCNSPGPEETMEQLNSNCFGQGSVELGARSQFSVV